MRAQDCARFFYPEPLIRTIGDYASSPNNFTRRSDSQNPKQRWLRLWSGTDGLLVRLQTAYKTTNALILL